MGGIALLARQAGNTVTGSDANVYPPMSTQLQAAGIELSEGYHAEHLQPAPDQVVIGNVMSRGNPAIEYLLNRNIPYTSGPQWLYENILHERWVLAVSGTHGKTTTASILAWILHYANLNPGFLIGGVPTNFGLSARLGESPFFVVEADEYDTAFFDKRSKFLHYHPRTLIINNLEFDHADIFDDLAAIQKQFHHLIRTVPGEGLIIHNQDDNNIAQVLEMGCWSERQEFSMQSGSPDWSVNPLNSDSSRFAIHHDGNCVVACQWGQSGAHNSANALAAMLASRHAGVALDVSANALAEFQGVKRRLELKGKFNGVALYDDFAHHPTEIEASLNALRARVGEQRIIAVFEPRSNTMKLGVHAAALINCFSKANEVILFAPDSLRWSVDELLAGFPGNILALNDIEAIVSHVTAHARSGDHVLVMSNGGFGGIHERLARSLENRS